MNKTIALLCLSIALVSAACRDPAHPPGTHVHADGTVHKDEPPKPADQDHAHGARHALGSVAIGEHTVNVFQFGDTIEAGKEGDFDLEFPAGKAMPGTVRGWIGVESAMGSMKVKFVKETENSMHGHPEAPKPIPGGSKLWIEIESAAGVQKGSVACRL